MVLCLTIVFVADSVMLLLMLLTMSLLIAFVADGIMFESAVAVVAVAVDVAVDVAV